MFAVETKEKIMRTYSLNELFRLTRRELLTLRAKIAAELSDLCGPERLVALENLRLLRIVLAHPRPAPS